MTAKSHKCTLIPGDIEAARRAGKLARGPAGDPCAHGLGEGREAVVPNTVEFCGEPPTAMVRSPPGTGSTRQQLGEHVGDPEGQGLRPSDALRTPLWAHRTPLPHLSTLI